MLSKSFFSQSINSVVGSSKNTIDGEQSVLGKVITSFYSHHCMFSAFIACFCNQPISIIDWTLDDIELIAFLLVVRKDITFLFLLIDQVTHQNCGQYPTCFWNELKLEIDCRIQWQHCLYQQTDHQWAFQTCGFTCSINTQKTNHIPLCEQQMSNYRPRNLRIVLSIDHSKSFLW